jgi:hydroxypyruvate isomerase
VVSDIESAQLRCSLNVTFHYWGRPLAESLDGAVAAGFRTIEMLDPYSIELDDLERELRQRGLTVDLFNLPMGDFYAGERGFAGDPQRRAEFRAGVEQAARIADRLGATKVNALAGMALDGEQEAAQNRCLVEQLGWAADRLAEHGVRLTTELLNPIETPGFLLSSLDQVTATLGQLDGRVGFQLDVYHVQRAHGDLVATIEATAAMTSHYQIADAPQRTEPGSGEIDFPSVLAAISATGYDGIVGCEYQPSEQTKDAFAWMDTMAVERA